MTGAQDDEDLRRRLYRPGASSEDLDAYLGVAAPAADPDPAAGSGPGSGTSPDASAVAVPPRRGRGTFAAVAIGALAVVLGASALAVGRVASTAEPTPSATPSAVAGFAGAPPAPDDVLGGPAPVDGGARAGARGTVATSGSSVRYTTRRGDTAPAVATRFGLCAADVLAALPYGFDPARLPGGQVLVLQRTGDATAQRGASTC
ncbi:hypothetical protein [Amnibacterium setariae]|uniref:LysM domain-containing protein n=1 Tax=Amnibacterium setariae TaxID=2306585 RepID=A0A3A1UAL0_9MICO|nr:hypothetical protein [Amnibacterium setariae]RIX30366.1 hypothetical protein D1781_02725 [Amnibacterium setariae]